MPIIETLFQHIGRPTLSKNELEANFSQIVQLIGGTAFNGGSSSPFVGGLDAVNFRVGSGFTNDHKSQPSSLLGLQAFYGGSLTMTNGGAAVTRDQFIFPGGLPNGTIIKLLTVYLSYGALSSLVPTGATGTVDLLVDGSSIGAPFPAAFTNLAPLTVAGPFTCSSVAKLKVYNGVNNNVHANQLTVRVTVSAFPGGAAVVYTVYDLQVIVWASALHVE